MFTTKTVTVGGSEYSVIVEEGVVVGLKRFNSKYGLEVEVHFSKENSSAEQTLVSLLEEAYLKQHLDS
ncbi:hypothetical protein [Paenibacillus sp. FSL R5-0912]|uniref:hypothetical protein n=1 Tax=Paenibacillus sp. FSL R5-0912 TaxID=1536771 RepID=UPI0004F67C22|nr:hypothetical protein [Paenibacillus sp. FSL R5-0912]AIQ40518.1 hypothetical protein R50912_11160 [Paenibacillus sp. FSL R5-0912]